MVPVGAIAAILVYAMRASRKGGSGGSPAPAAIPSSPLYFVGFLKGLVLAAAWGFLLAVVPFPVPIGFALVSDIWIATVGLHWLGWRLCYPLGLRRLGRVALWWAPHLRKNHEVGRLRLYDAAFGRSLPPATIDGWIACAAVLEAERARRWDAARALTDALLAVSLGAVLPSSVRSRGIELIAQAAADRGDWPEAFRRASLGRGRGPRFLRLLARAHVVGDVSPRLLWWAWALAPARRARYAMLGDALRAQPRGGSPTASFRLDAAEGPWQGHLRLLGRAASGDELALSDVLALARLWDDPLAPGGEARFRMRGLELGSTRAPETFRGLRESVLADLVAAARAARGTWPEDGAEDGAEDAAALVSELYDKLADEGFAAVETIARTRRHKKLGDLGPPLDEWRLWVRFREATERLAARFGEEQLRTAWYGGVQLAAWNWPCHLLEKYGDKAAWACHVMFRWTTEMAERCGDEEAATVNRRNAVTAQQRIRAA